MTTVIVDDTDLSQLKYTGRWTTGGVASEYNSTTHGTQTKGSAVTFQFHGTSIAVYGTIPIPPAKNNTAISTYKIDNSSPVTFTAPVVTAHQYHQLLYRSPDLQDGQHTLLITQTAESTLLWIDYITYTTTEQTGGATTLVSSKPVATSRAASTSAARTSSPAPVSSHPASSISAGPSSSSSLSSSVAAPASSASAASDAASTTSSPSNLPVILIAILVPLFLILFILLGLFWWRKRRAEKWRGNHVLLDENPATRQSVPPEAKNISPFFAQPPVYTPSAPPSIAGLETAYSASRAPSVFTVSNPDPFSPEAAETGSVVTSRAGGYLPKEGGGKGSSPLAVSNATYQQHSDGGVRLDGNGNPVVDVPPAYGRY